MTGVACIVPVLGRPQRVAPLLTSLNTSLAYEQADGLQVEVLFVCSDGDNPQIGAVKDAGLEPLVLTRPGRAEYARKVNLAARACSSEWLFLGADDLDFHVGWLRHAISAHIATGCLVVGTNDLANPAVIAGRHATHSLVHRDYLKQGTIDDSGKLLHEGYDHNSVDVEFTQTAQAREEWVFAEKSVVRHMHPIFDRTVKRDAVYNKGLKNAHVDRLLCQSRRHLWDPSAPRNPRLGTRHRQSLRMRAR